MDLNTILPIVLELLSQKTSNQPETKPPQQQYYTPPAPNPSDSYWQLPKYENSQQQNNKTNYSQNNFNNSQQNPCWNGQCKQNKSNYKNKSQSNNYQSINNGYQQSNNYGQQNNTSNATSTPPLDIATIIQLATQLYSLFPKKTPVVTEQEKEVSPSYISKLPHTDRFTFE